MKEIRWSQPKGRGIKGLSLLDASGWPEPFNTSQSDKGISVAQAYAYQAWLRRCLKKRSGTIASVPWTMHRGDTLLYDSDQPRDVPDELAWFDEDDAWRLLFLIDASLALAGRSYVFPQYTFSQIDFLQYLNPYTITEKERVKGAGISHYERRLSDGTFAGTIEKEDLIAFYDLDPFVEAGPAQGSDGAAAKVHATVLHELSGFASKSLRKDLIKATAVVPRDKAALPKPGTDAYNRMKGALRRLLGGRSQKDQIELVGNVDFMPIGEGLQGLANVNLTTEQRQATALGLGLTYGLVSPDSPNKATFEHELKNFYYDLVRPQCKRIASCLNKGCFRKEGLYFQFEFDRLEVFQEDQLAEADKVVMLVREGLISRSRAAEILGEDPEEVTEPPEEQEKSDEALNEIRQYRDKVKKKGREVSFHSVHAPASIAVIKTRLDRGETIEDAFEPPFVEP